MTLLAVCGDASTTTAFALARSWPADGVLLVEADPTGGDLAAWFDRPERPGVATAVSQASAGSWPQIASQLQPADGVDTLLMPIRSGEAEVAGREAGVRLAPTLAALDSVIAIADCGSVNPNAIPTMVSQASLVALTIRQPTTSARAAAAHLDRVSEVFDALRVRGVATVVVVIGEAPYRASEIAEFLAGTTADDSAPVDVIGFVLVAISSSWLLADTAPRADPDEDHSKGARAGLRTVRAHPPLARLLLVHGFAQIAQGGFVVLFVVFMVDVLGDDGVGVGVVRGAMAIGALAGSLLISRLATRVDSRVLYCAGLAGSGIVSALFWNAPLVSSALVVYIALFALLGVPGSALSVGLLTTIQTISPSHSLGRVFGFLGTAEALGIATGAILAGSLIDQVPLRPLLNAEATISLTASALAAVLLLRPSRLRAAAEPRLLRPRKGGDQNGVSPSRVSRRRRG